MERKIIGVIGAGTAGDDILGMAEETGLTGVGLHP